MIWIVSKNRGGRHSCAGPSPTIMAAGLGDDSIGHWFLEDDGMPIYFCQRDGRTGEVVRRDLSKMPAHIVCRDGIGDALAGGYWLEGDGMNVNDPIPTVQAGAGNRSSSKFSHGTNQIPPLEGSLKKQPAGKPPYRIPSIAEVVMIPWNGFTVASTFSGCGGSCLGWRMAGFRVAWASEFVTSAAESYKANAAPGSVLDERDVREVQAEEILAAIGMRRGELDVLDGSPPCQAFSTAGRRHKGWGKERSYGEGRTQRNEDMFAEFVRLLRGLEPRAFVAENVSGLAKGTCKGMFLSILADLKASGYRVSCRLLDAQWLGVPQVRKRLIFVGVREDLADAVGRPVQPMHPKPLPWRYSVLEAIPWLAGNLMHNRVEEEKTVPSSSPSPSVRAGRVHLGVEQRSKIVHPSGFKKGQTTSTGQPIPTVIARSGGIGGMGPRQSFIETEKIISMRRADGFDAEEWVPPNEPCYTIGTSPASGCNINANGGKIEVEKGTGEIVRRKFTIAELRRLCAFPDDFILLGSYAQQWACLGNAVPPLMMRAVAEVVRDEVLAKATKKPRPVGQGQVGRGRR